ncbi:MAG: ABC transporter permease, partial [Bacteroidaceae bacterium]|nr:ABC transporter permease [Bacteroidaceae bacterium]
ARLKNVSSEDFGQKTLQDILPRVRVKYILTGMIENYPTASLQKEINPQRITVRDSGDTYLGQIGKYVLIRLQPEKRKATLERIERIWKEMFNGQDLVYTDMHQRFLELNKDVMQLNRILNTYSLIALLLTCFGVFGISWYALRQRTREIAIRKVHGASTLNIVWLLNRPFFGQIVLAYIVSMPIAWYIMQWWSEQFVYRPTVTVLQFVLPFLVVWAVALLTVGIHSWIAAKVNPIHSLKIE